MNDTSLFTILLVEDNPAEARLTKYCFKEYNANIIVEHVTDGVEAMDYLYRKNKYENAIEPNIILLDLNLPRMDGMSVLEKIKNDEDLKGIPVIVFAISRNKEEIENIYENMPTVTLSNPLIMTNSWTL